jgi:uncharacterized membrane protein YkvA (DUF1232 family)
MARVRHATATKALWTVVRGARRPGGPTVRAQLAAVPRMVLQGFTGRYPGLDRARIGLVVLGLAYVISPLDLIPEAVFLVLGLGDDALVAAWVVGTLLSEAAAFLEWEHRRERVVPGEVLTTEG